MTPDIIPLIALTLGASWASGINLYAAILTLGIMHNTGSVHLPPGLELLGDPLVLGAAGLMYAVEFFADKIPGVDNAWDTLHTFIRIPAGIMLAYGATTELGPAAQIAASIIGGGMATASHATKAGGRVVINTSPEPVTNWIASITEDAAVIGGLWTAMHYPITFILLLILFIAFAIWILPKIWRGIKRIFRFFLKLFGKKVDEEEIQSLPAPNTILNPASEATTTLSDDKHENQ